MFSVKCGENYLFEVFNSADFEGGDFLSPIYLSNIITWQAMGFEKNFLFKSNTYTIKNLQLFSTNHYPKIKIVQTSATKTRGAYTSLII